MGSITKVQQERQAKNTNLHKLSRMGYAGLVEKMEKTIGRELTNIDRPDLWIMAHVNEHGNYMNGDIKATTDKIVS